MPTGMDDQDGFEPPLSLPKAHELPLLARGSASSDYATGRNRERAEIFTLTRSQNDRTKEIDLVDLSPHIPLQGSLAAKINIETNNNKICRSKMKKHREYLRRASRVYLILKLRRYRY